MENYGADIVSKTTTFINDNSSTNVVDVAFVDEALRNRLNEVLKEEK